MRPTRLVSLLAGGTEILYGLGLGDRVVGISHECDYPPEAIDKPRVTCANIAAQASSADIDAEVKARLARSEALYRIDLDLLAELAPDLIVTQSQCEVCAVSADEVEAAIADVPALRDIPIVSLNPTTLPAVFDDIRRVGHAAGVDRQAGQYVASLQARVEWVRSATAKLDLAAKPRVACIEWVDPLMIAANWMPELVDTAGGRNELTKAGDRTAYAAPGALIEYDPEVIVIAPCGFDLQRTIAELIVLARSPGWTSLSAVRGGRVFAADGNAYFNRSGPRLVDTLELLAGILHPALFRDFAAKYEPFVASC